MSKPKSCNTIVRPIISYNNNIIFSYMTWMVVAPEIYIPLKSLNALLRCHCAITDNIRGFSLYFQVSKEELAKLVQSFEEQDILTSSGVTLAGSRYIYLSGTDRVIRAKLGKIGVHCMKTTQAVVVSLYEDPIQPQQAASVVEKLGEYLVSCGY